MSAITGPADPIGSAVGSARRPRLTPYEITWLLAACARTPVVMMAARERVQTTMFEPAEMQFVLLWRGLSAAADDHGGRVPADAASANEIIALKCAAAIAADPGRVYFTPSVEQAVMSPGGLIDQILMFPSGPDVESQGLSLLGRFVTERLFADPLRKALSGIGSGETLADPGALLESLERQARDAAGIGVDPGASVFVSGASFLPRGPKLFSTQLTWLDDILNGGQAGGECYALLAPTGGGKSLLASQIAIEGAQLQAALAAEMGPDNAGHWYYFTYELTQEQMRPRMWGYAARLHCDTYMEKDPADVTYSTSDRPETLKPYESDPYVNAAGNPVLGETERIASVDRRLTGVNDRLKLVDYSSASHNGAVGNGSVNEIAAYLRREESRGRRVAGVVVDYAGLAVERHINSRNLKPEAAYPLLTGYINQVRSQVAIPFKCPAWVLHQLHGSVAKRPAGAKVYHNDALGSRNFADNSDFCLQLSPYNRTTGLLTVHCTKHRRGPGREDGVVVRMRGEYMAIVSPDQEFTVDPATRQIVPKGYTDMIAKPTASGRHTLAPFDPMAGLR